MGCWIIFDFQQGHPPSERGASDIGTNAKLLRPTCPTDVQEKLAVWVTHESSSWQTNERALQTFTFHVRGNCVAAVNP